MKVGFSKPTQGEEERRDLFSRFRSMGYDGLQLKIGQYRDYIDDPEIFMSEWADYPGVGSGLIFASTLDDAGVASLRNVLRFGEMVGSERLIFCHTEPRETISKNDIRRFARTLSELGHEGRELGISLSLHHHYGHPVMHRADFEAFFDVADTDAVGLTLDTAHLIKSGIEDIAGIVEEFGDVLDNVHLKDIADGRFSVLGEGRIDFQPVFAALRAIGYDGWFCADEESEADLIQAMESCRRFIGTALLSQRRTTNHA